MENKEEIRMIFTELSFTGLCKNGFLTHNSKLSGKTQIDFTSKDIKELVTGKIIQKELDDVVIKFALQDLGTEMIKEILKRSPIYSSLATEI
jgi:hypothetical protein